MREKREKRIKKKLEEKKERKREFLRLGELGGELILMKAETSWL